MPKNVNQTDNYARALKKERNEERKRMAAKYNQGNLDPTVNPPENVNEKSKQDNQERQGEKSEKKSLRDRALEYQRELKRHRKAANKLKEVKDLTAKQEVIGLKVKKFQRIYRFINATSAVTPFGIFLTCLVMNAQLIFGNLFRVKIVPKLEWWEIIILLLVDSIVAFIILLVIVVVCLIAIKIIVILDWVGKIFEIMKYKRV